MVASGHPAVARNHSVGAPTHHHSSSTSFTTQRSNRSLPTQRTTKTTTTSTTTTATANVVYEDDNNRLNEKNLNNAFNFQYQISNFHNSSINQQFNDIHMQRSTRHLCGSIMPLESSTSSPNIDHRSIENDHLHTSLLASLSFQKPNIKYRS